MRMAIIFASLLFAFGGLWLRGAYLQLAPIPRLQKLEKRQFETRLEVHGRRGVIVDRNGRELAASIPAWSVYVDPMLVERPYALAAQLSRLLGAPRRQIQAKLKQKKRFVWVDRHISVEKAEQIRKLDWRGVGLIEEPKRVYPNRSLAGQVLGFVGRDGAGLEGIEKAFDDRLSGEKRDVVLPRDARGRPIVPIGGLLTSVQDGARLELTIDAEMQFNLEQELMRVLVEKRADAAIGLVMDPHTGEVLAMASQPSYNPEEALQTPSEHRRIRAITDAFEPGSTLKTLVIASALKHNLIKPSTKIDCEGGRLRLGDRWIREADTHHRFDQLTVAEVLAFSSNIGSAKIGLMMGDELLRQSLQGFGIGEKLGIDLPGESRGILQALPWRPHLLGNVAFGHGVAVTPLQIASAYAVIANGGNLVRPRLVKGPPVVLRRVLSEEQAATMRLMLRAATMEHATGEKARIEGFPVAGKTGTAQKVDHEKGGYQAGAYISSFAGFVPAHAPKFVIYIAVDNPRAAYYASEVAAPVFARMAQFAVRRAGLAPILVSEGQVFGKPPSLLIQVEAQNRALAENRHLLEHQSRSVMPDLHGLTLRAALQRLRPQPLKVEILGKGVVARSEPRVGEPLPEQGRVRLFLQEDGSGVASQ